MFAQKLLRPAFQSFSKLPQFRVSQALQGNKVQLKIQDITTISDDTKIYHLELQKDQVIGINTGEHIQFWTEHEGESIRRSYTPISPPTKQGVVDVLVKIYRKNNQFPEGGKLTGGYLDTLQVNDFLTVGGPVGRINYKGEGKFLWKKEGEERQYKKLIMVAGGSGITPIYQILQQIQNNNEPIQAKVIFGNKSPNDILLKQELEELSNSNPNIDVTFLVDQGGNSENGLKNGLVTKELMEELLHKSDGETLAICCGPPGMNKVVLNNFDAMGYSLDDIFKF